MAKTLYMVIEHFKVQDSTPVYRRFGEKGRMTPVGLRTISGWDNRKDGICYQLMETAEYKQFDEWTAHWNDLIDFEIHPIRNVREAFKAFGLFAAGRSPKLVIWHTMRFGRRVILNWFADLSEA